MVLVAQEIFSLEDQPGSWGLSTRGCPLPCLLERGYILTSWSFLANIYIYISSLHGLYDEEDFSNSHFQSGLQGCELRTPHHLH